MFKTYEAVIVKQPKISTKQLCEYAEATASGRLSILKACKIKNPGVIAIARRYNEAEDLICTFMEHSMGFYAILLDYAKDLRKNSLKKTGKDKENTLACAEALEAFYNMNLQLQSLLEDAVLRNSTSNSSNKLKIKGVTISIRPEIKISRDAGDTECGFVKLYFGKTTPLTKTMGENMAMLGRYYFRQVHGVDYERQNCIVIDVFARKIYCAPKAEKRALYNLEACCTEIADRWEKI